MSANELLTGKQPVHIQNDVPAPQTEVSQQMMNALATYDTCDTYCCRRNMLARAVGAAALVVGAPALAAETKMVLMGVDGGLVFSPADVTICKGDSVTWKNNALGPHNVVFQDVPEGIEAEDYN